MQLHDILQLRTSVILPEAISDGGLAPTTDTSLFLTTYRAPLKNRFYIQYIVAQNIQVYFILCCFAQNKDFFSGVPIEVGVISHLIYCRKLTQIFIKFEKRTLMLSHVPFTMQKLLSIFQIFL